MTPSTLNFGLLSLPIFSAWAVFVSPNLIKFVTSNLISPLESIPLSIRFRDAPLDSASNWSLSTFRSSTEVRFDFAFSIPFVRELLSTSVSVGITAEKKTPSQSSSLGSSLETCGKLLSYCSSSSALE